MPPAFWSSLTFSPPWPSSEKTDAEGGPQLESPRYLSPPLLAAPAPTAYEALFLLLEELNSRRIFLGSTDKLGHPLDGLLHAVNPACLLRRRFHVVDCDRAPAGVGARRLRVAAADDAVDGAFESTMRYWRLVVFLVVIVLVVVPRGGLLHRHTNATCGHLQDGLLKLDGIGMVEALGIWRNGLIPRETKLRVDNLERVGCEVDARLVRGGRLFEFGQPLVQGTQRIANCGVAVLVGHLSRPAPAWRRS